VPYRHFTDRGTRRAHRRATTDDRNDVNDLQQFAQQVLAAQPFSRLVGTRLTASGPDHAELSIDVREDLTQQHGFVHGGVVSYLADNAITFAGGLALGGDALTAEYKINYLRPATGPVLVARAHAQSVGTRQAVCRCDLYTVIDGHERLCAIAQGTVVPVPAQD
jgi:uncharacterized protein (TIGR00369 family)